MGKTVSIWTELKHSVQDLVNLFQGKRKNIANPEIDPSLSIRENYMRRFETQISFTGDIIMKLAPYEEYASREEWNEQLQIHKEKLADYLNTRFVLIDSIHTLIHRVILAYVSIKSAIDSFFSIKAACADDELVNWQPLVWNLFVWLFYLLFRKFKKPIMQGFIGVIKWAVIKWSNYKKTKNISNA